MMQILGFQIYDKMHRKITFCRVTLLQSLQSLFYFCDMLPDYPHKLFSDKRSNYSLLMEVLATDAV